MPKVAVNGVQIFYQLTGEGDYLMHVPGAVVAPRGLRSRYSRNGKTLQGPRFRPSRVRRE